MKSWHKVSKVAGMPRRLRKYKLLLDENFPPKTYFPITNSRFNLKHIASDLKLGGSEDLEVYQVAVKQKRLVVTFDVDDFKKLAIKSKNSGVIGISAALANEQIDKKLNALLTKGTLGDLYGKFLYIQ